MNLLLAFAIVEFILIFLLLLGYRGRIRRFHNREDESRRAIEQMRKIIDYYQGRTTQFPPAIQRDLFEYIAT